MKTYNNGRAPSVIPVPIYYENNTKEPYYSMATEEYNIDRVDLNTIYEFYEEEDCTSVSYWEPSELGYNCMWRMSAEEFLKLAKLTD